MTDSLHEFLVQHSVGLMFLKIGRLRFPVFHQRVLSFLPIRDTRHTLRV